MSYILEALKKSESERNKDGVPNLYTNHSPSSVRVRQRRAPVFKWAAAGTMLLAGIAAAVFFWQQRQPEAVLTEVSPPAVVAPVLLPVPEPVLHSEVAASVPAAPVSNTAPLPRVVPVEVVRESVQAAKNDMVQANPAPQPESETVAVAAEVKTPERDVVPVKKESAVVVPPPPALPVNTDYPLLEELSLSVRDRIPELHFAGHVYSANSSGRMIIINNRIVREGDVVGDNLALQKITSEGVVMQFEDSVFKVKLF